MKHDVKFWLLERITAVCLLPIVVYLLFCILTGHNAIHVHSVGSIAKSELIVLPAIFNFISNHIFSVAFFVLISLYHSTMGIQVIIEDYISYIKTRNSLIILLRILSVATAMIFLFTIFSLIF